MFPTQCILTVVTTTVEQKYSSYKLVSAIIKALKKFRV